MFRSTGRGHAAPPPLSPPDKVVLAPAGPSTADLLWRCGRRCFVLAVLLAIEPGDNAPLAFAQGQGSAPRRLTERRTATPTVSPQVEVLTRDRLESQFLPAAESSDPLPTAVGGFCVVTLRDQGKWVPGRPELGAIFDGRKFLFADQRQRAVFAAEPQRYAPVLQGDCLVIYANRGQRTAGRVECGLLHDGRLFFFASPEHRLKFVNAPADFVSADLVAQGQCVVTRLEEGRAVSGNPAAMAIYEGQRYLFQGTQARDRFLADPEKYAAPSGQAGGIVRRTPQPTPGSTLPLNSDNAKAIPEDESAPLAPSPTNDLAAIPAEDNEASPSVEFAMGGYCPVSIRDEARWVRGEEDHWASIEEIYFAFAGPSQRETFLRNPARYVPVLGGACAVTYAKTRKVVPGSMYHAVESPELNLMFMFAGAEEMAAFKAEPSAYLRVDLAMEGLCVVSLGDDKVRVAGLPEFSAWYEGNRYFFADATRREVFLANPANYAIDPHAPITRRSLPDAE